MYKKGTIKVAWISKNDYNELNSMMFNSLKDALEYVKGKDDYMIMELVENNGDYYKWKVLPYGNYRSYNYGMIISKNIILKTFFLGLVIYGSYSLIKDRI